MLMADANKAIEEAQEELHDIKAKLKHMVLSNENPNNSLDLSSYKGDDSSTSAADCLEKIQNMLLQR